MRIEREGLFLGDFKELKEFTEKYGKGFLKRALYQYVEFYHLFPEIVQSLNAQSFPVLSWTHYSVLLRVADKSAREWYAQEAANETWSVRTL